MPQATAATLRLVFASHNRHKLAEYRNMAPPWLQLLALADHQFSRPLPETQSSLEGNACQKACFVFEYLHADCFADDSGLEVDALGGAPGYRSAQYAGPAATDEQNITRLLRELRPYENRKARFRTVICLIYRGRRHLFSGALNGAIAHQPAGSYGFGYDPVFIPEGSTKTLAQMTAAEKNAISHRRACFERMLDFLKFHSGA